MQEGLFGHKEPLRGGGAKGLFRHPAHRAPTQRGGSLGPLPPKFHFSPTRIQTRISTCTCVSHHALPMHVGGGCACRSGHSHPARHPWTSDALEGKGPQGPPQRRLDRRLEEVAKAVGGSYCRLQMSLRLALGVRETMAGHRLGALEGGGVPPPPFPMHPCPGPWTGLQRKLLHTSCLRCPFPSAAALQPHVRELCGQPP